MSDTGFFLLPTNKLYIKKKKILEGLKAFLQVMSEIFSSVFRNQG